MTRRGNTHGCTTSQYLDINRTVQLTPRWNSPLQRRVLLKLRIQAYSAKHPGPACMSDEIYSAQDRSSPYSPKPTLLELSSSAPARTYVIINLLPESKSDGTHQ